MPARSRPARGPGDEHDHGSDELGPDEPGSDERDGHAGVDTGRRTVRVIGEYAGLAVLAIVLSSLLKAFVGLAFYIPSGSMEPTLHINDRVVVSRLSYHLHEPHRGDVIVFQNPDWVAPPRPNLAVRMVREVLEVVGAQQPREKNLIKRVIGLPGERLAVHDGKVWIDGKELAQPWIDPGVETFVTPDERDNLRFEVTVPKDRYVVLGDNRGNSCDSRCFTAGPFVKRSSIVGRAFVRIWPVWRFAWL